MKKVLCIFIICVASLLNAKDGEDPFEMGYYSSEISRAYSPNIYRNFQSSVVHTKQLEIQEYMLQRLDWLHLNIGKLANGDKKLDNIAEGTSNLIKNTDTIEAIGVWIIILLTLILITLNCILRAINKNTKLLQNCIQSE